MDIGTQIGPYRIDGLLGRGGMAEVYKAWHGGLHRHEALKALPPHMTFDRSFVERFLAEARTAAGLHHRHIATIHTVSAAAAAQPYFTMELVEGGDLADLLARRHRLSLAEALPLLEQIGAALDYAHSRGVIHCDIKPGNILLRDDGQGGWDVQVVDFGIARAAEETGGIRLTKTGMIVGTPEYMSPEQGGSGAAVDHRTDIYSLGIIAYELLCGQPPFQAASNSSAIPVIMSHVRDAPAPPIERVPGLPRSVNDALLRALAKNPAERFDSCAAFVAALKSGTNRRVGYPPGDPPAPRPRTMPVLVGLAMLAGLGLIGYGLLTPKPGPVAPPHDKFATPTPEIVPPKVTIPSLLGLKEDAARKNIAAASLKPEVTTDHSNSVPAGQVMSQHPPAGAFANRGAPVRVRISIGLTEAERQRRAEQQRLAAQRSAAAARRSAAARQLLAQRQRAMEAELPQFVESWRAAWQSHDLERFMAHYASQVKVDGQWQSRSHYRSYHADENSKQPSMEITVNNVQVHPEDENKALITFEQQFKGYSPSYRLDYESGGRTTLTVEKVGGGWQIVSERFRKEWSRDH